MKTEIKNQNAANAAEVLSVIAADAPMIQAATPKPLGAWENEPTDAPLNPVNRPSAEWTLDQLGHFAAVVGRKNAEHAWELGRALFLAQKKTGKGGKWTAWADKWVPWIKERTRQRYMNVGQLDYEDVKGKGLDEVYKLLSPPPKKAKAKPPTTDSTTQPHATTPPTDEASKPTVGQWSDRHGPLDEQEAALVNAKNVLEDLMANPEQWKDVLDYYRDDLKTLAENLLKFLADPPTVAS